tara:strand:+ start:936 stop:1724 length:789 start_codon:yes stop_codon:yes gene_type:complete
MDEVFMRSNRSASETPSFELRGDGLGTVGQYDVHEHEVLLSQNPAVMPAGTRQLKTFSSLVNVSSNHVISAEAFIKRFKYAGVSVTPFTPRMDASQFDSGQGFVTTFTGLNVVRVAHAVNPGDQLVAVPPKEWAISNLGSEPELNHDSSLGKRRGVRMFVYPLRKLNQSLQSNNQYLQEWTIGRCAGGASKVIYSIYISVHKRFTVRWFSGQVCDGNTWSVEWLLLLNPYKFRPSHIRHNNKHSMYRSRSTRTNVCCKFWVL